MSSLSDIQKSHSSSSRLAVLIGSGGVDTLICDDGAAPVLRHIAVDPAVTAPEKVLEEAVYTTPSLLADYAATEIIADSSQFLIVPPAVAPDALLHIWPSEDSDRIAISPCANTDAAVAAIFSQSLDGFVHRTFPRATLRHRMANLIDFYASLSRPANKIKLYARLQAPSRLDIVALSADGLALANTFDVATTLDAVYYVMAAVKVTGLDPLDDEVVVTGDDPRLPELTESLRRYLNSVMPLLLPSPQSDMPLELLTAYKSCV